MGFIHPRSQNLRFAILKLCYSTVIMDLINRNSINRNIIIKSQTSYQMTFCGEFVDFPESTTIRQSNRSFYFSTHSVTSSSVIETIDSARLTNCHKWPFTARNIYIYCLKTASVLYQIYMDSGSNYIVLGRQHTLLGTLIANNNTPWSAYLENQIIP